MIVVVLFLFIFGSFGYYENSWTPVIWDISCPFSRDDVLNAMKEVVDVAPKDDQITKYEIDLALRNHLPWYLKPAVWVGSVDDIIESCDYDKNGVITPRDFMMSKNTCLPLKKNWCTVEWFYDKIKAGKL